MAGAARPPVTASSAPPPTAAAPTLRYCIALLLASYLGCAEAASKLSACMLHICSKARTCGQGTRSLLWGHRGDETRQRQRCMHVKLTRQQHMDVKLTRQQCACMSYQTAAILTARPGCANSEAACLPSFQGNANNRVNGSAVSQAGPAVAESMLHQQTAVPPLTSEQRA